MPNRINVWNSEKECYEVVDGYQGVMDEYAKYAKYAEYAKYAKYGEYMCQNYDNKPIEIGEVRYSLLWNRQVTVERVHGNFVYLRETKTGTFFKRISVILFQDYRLYSY